MKTTITPLILILSYSPTFSQDWSGVLRWLYHQSIIGPPDDVMRLVEVRKVGIEIIESKNCVVLEFKHIQIDDGQHEEGVLATYAVFLEDGVCQVYNDYDSSFHQVYDFNLQVGDTLQSYSPWCPQSKALSVVDSIGVITIDGQTRRFQQVTDIDTGCFLRGMVIEGIGGERFLFPNSGIIDPPVGGKLLCHQDADLIYPEDASCDIIVSTEDIASNGRTIYPNPTDSWLWFSTDSPIQWSVHDIVGRKLAHGYSAAIDISYLYDGNYFVLLEENGSIERHHVVKTSR